MSAAGTGILWLGYGLLLIGGTFVLIGYAGIVLFAPSLGEGLLRLRDVLSPFNVGNWLAVALTLLPGALIISLGHRLRRP